MTGGTIAGISADSRHSASHGIVLPIWLVLLGNLVMGGSLWLIAAGGMMAKLILLVFWGIMVLGFLRGLRFSPTALIGGGILLGLITVIVVGSGVGVEKLRLVGNLLMLPVGLLAGCVIGRDCLRIIVPVLVVYLVLSSSFYVTHDGMRLNQPFLFLGLFALCSVAQWRGHRWLGGTAGIAVLLSQTRIAVLAMLVNLMGAIWFSRVLTWLFALCAVGVLGWAAVDHLPRLFLTHGSGRFPFWQEFWELWRAASMAQQWFGFGAGAVEAILSSHISFGSFGALHNDHFRILFETGIVGAVLWLLGWIVMLWAVRHVRLSVCLLLSVMLTMVTDNTLTYGHYLICCGIAAGISVRRGGCKWIEPV
ncbi:O-antigen ligase family protein [Thalassospira australica]|uniref:O-antigen ligase family protein n=1 Tax=Thalassospira australica TaxID=1528106 RepID=UPI00051A872D|nr:O-antigen ligase family protein [Thalassospira australica]